MSETIFQTVRDMAAIIDAEGLGRDPDKAALRLIARGYRPRHVAAFLDLAMSATVEPTASPSVARPKTSQGIE